MKNPIAARTSPEPLHSTAGAERFVTVAKPGDRPSPAGLIITCDDGELAPAVVRLTENEAWCFAQFLKRSTWHTFLRLSANGDSKEETQVMIDAACKIRRCFNEAGFDPR